MFTARRVSFVPNPGHPPVMTNTNRVPEGVPTGGQFAASAKAEATGVALDASDIPVGQEQYADTPLAKALTEAGLPGAFTMTGESTADYSDNDGHFYDIDYSEKAIQVRSQDTDASSFMMPFDPKRNPLHPSEVVDAVESCRRQATEIRSFNTVASEWLATPKTNRGPSWPEPEFDYDAGKVSLNGVTLRDFTLDDPDMRGATMRLQIDDGAEFTYFRNARTGEYAVYRGEDRAAPMAQWEIDSLDATATQRLGDGRHGYVASVRRMFHDSIQSAEQDL